MRLPDSRVGGVSALFVVMQASLSSDDRLALLQEIDDTHRWDSLDDRRVCVVCEQIFCGHDVRFQSLGRLGVSLHCPTDDCPGQPVHWLNVPAAADMVPGTHAEFSFL